MFVSLRASKVAPPKRWGLQKAWEHLAPLFSRQRRGWRRQKHQPAEPGAALFRIDFSKTAHERRAEVCRFQAHVLSVTLWFPVGVHINQNKRRCTVVHAVQAVSL